MCAANAKLVLIGWHGADWRSIHPLLDAGLMPNLRSLVERGVAGNLKPSGPAVPESLWTSIATGKSADQHGILSAVEPDPLSGGARPARSTSRRVKALWNIAMQSGLVTHVVGWSGTFPAEKLNGSCIAPEFVQPLARYGAPWPILPNSLYPERLSGDLAGLRVHAGELTGEDLRPFLPHLSEIDQEADRRVVDFADALAQTISTHAITTWLLEHEPWNVMMIGWRGLQRACHLFMRYAAPQLPGVSEQDCARYGEIVKGMYCYHDMLLGRILQLAGPEATIAIVSAAGFRTGAERPISTALQRLPVAWYRPYGIFCLAGPNIVSDELVHGVNILDVAPTMLSVLGLERASDMPGRVPAEAFEDPPPAPRIASWEAMPGDCGMSTSCSAEEQASAAATIAELGNLGYTDAVAGAPVMSLQRGRLYNTAVVHLAHGRYSEARSVLMQLEGVEREPKTALLLAYCHFRCGDFASCTTALRNAPATGLAAAHAKMLESYAAAAQGNTRKASSAMQAAERLGFDRPFVNWIAGTMYVRLGQLSRAEAALRAAVALDPSFEQAHALLARVLTVRGKPEEAAQTALDGLSVDHSSASLHSALGIALAKSGDSDKALEAFELSLTFDPTLREAAAWSEEILARRQRPA